MPEDTAPTITTPTAPNVPAYEARIAALEHQVSVLAMAVTGRATVAEVEEALKAG